MREKTLTLANMGAAKTGNVSISDIVAMYHDLIQQAKAAGFQRLVIDRIRTGGANPWNLDPIEIDLTRYP